MLLAQSGELGRQVPPGTSTRPSGRAGEAGPVGQGGGYLRVDVDPVPAPTIVPAGQ